MASKTCDFYNYVMFCSYDVICWVTIMKTMDYFEVVSNYMLLQIISFPSYKVNMIEFQKPRKIC